VNEDRAALAAEVAQVSRWWHSIDLGGIVTPGEKGDLAAMERELASLRLPDVKGRTVLDIGAWDGFYSFAAERLGASRVVALDHFVWEREDHGGGAGFALAHRVLESDVERLHADFMTCDLAGLGRFDVVLFLGVLYHLEAPLTALRRLYEVTGEVAVIETEAMELVGSGRRPLVEFFPGAELAQDPTNWWSPNLAALVAMCEAAGFATVDVVVGAPKPASRLRRPARYRAVVHAYR
jgi:tRNA (mo5U34)-methyltransferase